MTNLKPCPFCGGEAEIVNENINLCYDPERLDFRFVSCKVCDVLTSPETSHIEGQIKAWNTRVGESDDT